MSIVTASLIDVVPTEFFFFDQVFNFFGGTYVYYLGTYGFGAEVSTPEGR